MTEEQKKLYQYLYSIIENEVYKDCLRKQKKSYIEKGKKIEVDIKINYNSTRRPTDFEVIYYIDGIRNKKLFLNE